MKLRIKPRLAAFGGNGDSAGQSLVSVLIGIGLAGGLAMVMASLFTSASKSQAGVQQFADYTEAVRTVSTVLMQPSLCSCNLAPQTGSGHPFSFSAASASTAKFGLAQGFGALRQFNADCSAPGPVFLQATATHPGNSQLWIKDLELTGFSRIDDNNYSANVRLVAQKTVGSSGWTKDFPVTLRTTTSGGTVTVQACLSASTAASCVSTQYLEPFGGPLPVTNGYRCPARNQLMTQCQAIEFPSGGAVCGTRPNAGVDAAGYSYCATNGCMNVPHSQQWGVQVTCCTF